MDLSQTKLTRSEWNNIEIPTEKELEIIDIICKGYVNVNVRENKTLSIIQYLKIMPTDIINKYIFCVYLQNTFIELNKKYDFQYRTESFKKNKMKKADIIRFSNSDKQLSLNKKNIFEYMILDHLTKMITDYKKNNIMWQLHYYTIHTLMRYNITNINPLFRDKIKTMLEIFEGEISITELINMADILVEKNHCLLKYADIQLYERKKNYLLFVKSTRSLFLILHPQEQEKRCHH